MKTPMQELLERVKEYRDSETDVIVRSRLNSVCVDIVGMLEKEEDYHKRIREIVAQELHNLGMPTDRAIDQAAFESSYGYSDDNYNSFKEGVKWVIEQLKTFNTEER